MDDSSANGTTRHVTAIRATSGQTAILKKEFKISDTPSEALIRALSDQLNLPSKWVYNWFARQRAKANRSKPQASQQSYIGTYSLDPAFSTQEVLRNKRELVDTDALSGSSSMAEVASVSDYATISTSSSSTLDQSTASDPPRKRRGRPSQRKSSPARTLRSSKRKDLVVSVDSTQLAGVRPECIETSGGLRHAQTGDDSLTRVAVSGINSGKNIPTMAITYNQLMPSVAPPKRSPMAPPNNAMRSRTRNTRSGLSSNQPESIYARIPPGDTFSEQGAAAAHNHSITTRFARTQKPQKATTVRHGPVFHTKFQNNAPESFSSSRILHPMYSSSYSMEHYLPRTSVPMPPLTLPETSASMLPQLPLSSTTLYNEVESLTPAFGWEAHSPSYGTVAMLSKHGVISHVALDSVPYVADPSHAYYAGYYSNQYSPGRDELPDEPLTLHSRPELTDTILLSSHKEILNPSLAPLKHLTDLLASFKDEQGTYGRLLVYEERDNLMKCLLDENLVQDSPFQAAMALSLLSKLGFEWDY